MNTENLQQIFAHYTERFEELNNAECDENFKWRAAKLFRERMDAALTKDGREFADALKKIVREKITKTIVDNYTQPFAGLVELAYKEPETVKEMLLGLFADDGNDLKLREQKISTFFAQSGKLLETYFPGSFRYKQDAHAVSAYLFLYDPDHHYLYKPTQARLFADCVEFYGDWGAGNHIKLDVFYRMCDELVAEIKKCPALLATDQSRFDGRFRVSPEEMSPDKEKHILAFDIIYCSMVYDLFKGITFKSITVKEKKLYEERLKKATELQESYVRAEERYRQLEEAIQHYKEVLVPGTPVQSRMLGEGKILEAGTNKISVQFASIAEPKNFDFFSAITGQFLKFEDSLDEETAELYRELFKRHSEIQGRMPELQKQLEEYRDILE